TLINLVYNIKMYTKSSIKTFDPFYSSTAPSPAGYYLYIEGDSALHGDTARLLSDECSDIQPQCLQFWYHMYGSSWTMGLSVYLLHGNVAQEVWRKREDQGNAWHQAQVNITPHGKFKILFEGRRGHNDRSDVALDDVTLLRGPCAGLLKDPLGSPVPEMPTIISPVGETTTPLQSQTRTSVVAPVHRNGPVLVRSNSSPVCGMNCNFDYNLCTWTQLLTDVFDWTRQQGSTPTLMTGPSSDHTTGAGYYLYIEGDSAVHGDTARLLSEECTDVQPQCLQFWYHMYGSSWTMGLSVYLLHGNVAQEVWRKREDQGNIWHQALVDITPHGKFKILFEGRRGHNDRSDVALDDVFIHRGTCAVTHKSEYTTHISKSTASIALEVAEAPLVSAQTIHRMLQQVGLAEIFARLSLKKKLSRWKHIICCSKTFICLSTCPDVHAAHSISTIAPLYHQRCRLLS
ncbi:MAM and LDL-receptor class A domain-containing protein 1, partial [Silurus asotus]